MWIGRTLWAMTTGFVEPFCIRLLASIKEVKLLVWQLYRILRHYTTNTMDGVCYYYNCCIMRGTNRYFEVSKLIINAIYSIWYIFVSIYSE